VPIPADGRCLWASIWLGAVASEVELLGWYLRSRNESGVAMHKEDAARETSMVLDWASALEGMPNKIRERLVCGISSQHEELETRLQS